MKALTYLAAKKVAIEEHLLPELAEGTIRVKVMYCGICGSDMGIYRGTHPRAKAPLILGHELVGTVSEINNDGSRFQVGQRALLYPQITCGTCYACTHGLMSACEHVNYFGIDRAGGIGEYIDVPEEFLIPVPDRLSNIAASVIEPLAVAFHAAKKAQVACAARVLIMGAGPIGLLLALTLRQQGVAEIWLSEISEWNIEMCKKMGFSAIDTAKEELIPQIMNLTDGIGVDVVFECSGAGIVTESMTKVCRIGGTMCVVATHKAPCRISFQDIMFREQHILGARGYAYDEFLSTVHAAAQMGEQLEAVVTHVIPLMEAGGVFEFIANRDNATMKVLIDCQI